jgi:hypothetical protein
MWTKSLISPTSRNDWGSAEGNNQCLSAVFRRIGNGPSTRPLFRGPVFARRTRAVFTTARWRNLPRNRAGDGVVQGAAAKLPHLGSSKVAKHSLMRRIRLANRCCGGVIISASATMLMKSKDARFNIISNAREKQNK